MTEGVKAKHECVIKNYFNFHEVWFKRENEELDV
jgi:hypothetical protein